MIALRILLIEDDAMISLALAETLAALGHAVCATEATEAGAVAAAAQHRPDLLIVDMSLEQGSGSAAVRRIEQAAPVPHLFISGGGQRAAPPGAVLLVKPFRQADLVRAIERVLPLAGVPMRPSA